jgi:hypothetical protein
MKDVSTSSTVQPLAQVANQCRITLHQVGIRFTPISHRFHIGPCHLHVGLHRFRISSRWSRPFLDLADTSTTIVL